MTKTSSHILLWATLTMITLSGFQCNFQNRSNYYNNISYLINVFYLTGYHHCTKEEASVLGALIYRVKYGESKTELANLTQMLRELIPTDLVITLFCQFFWKKGKLLMQLTGLPRVLKFTQLPMKHAQISK